MKLTMMKVVLGSVFVISAPYIYALHLVNKVKGNGKESTWDKMVASSTSLPKGNNTERSVATTPAVKAA